MRSIRAYIFLSIFFSSLAFPACVSASISISEIMYDVSGTDTGREWIEIVNEGTDSVDISGFKLFEANTNHGLVPMLGGTILAPGAAAVIADNSVKFLLDWPGYSGILFDSSFSLSNTGETLSIRNGELIDQHTVTYSSAMGANGDGNTLSRNGSTFASATPSPGSFAAPTSHPPAGGDLEAQTEADAGASSAEDASDAAQPTAQTQTQTALQTKHITVDAGSDRSVIVGADTSFSATVYGTKDEPISNARVLWNFGSGEVKEGKTVLFHYLYPGSYRVAVTGSSGEYSATDYFTIEAKEAQLSLVAETDGSLSVLNRGTGDIDLGLWVLARGGVEFRIPEKTLVMKGVKVRFATDTTELPSAGAAELWYPNRVRALEADAPGAVPAQGASPAVRAKGAIGTVIEKAAAPAAVASVAKAPAIAQEPPSQGTPFSHTIGWLLGVLGIAILGAGTAVAVRLQASPKSEADEFELVQ